MLKYNIIITKLLFNDAAAKWSPHCEIAFARDLIVLFFSLSFDSQHVKSLAFFISHAHGECAEFIFATLEHARALEIHFFLYDRSPYSVVPTAGLHT